MAPTLLRDQRRILPRFINDNRPFRFKGWMIFIIVMMTIIFSIAFASWAFRLLSYRHRPGRFTMYRPTQPNPNAILPPATVAYAPPPPPQQPAPSSQNLWTPPNIEAGINVPPPVYSKDR